MARLILEDMKLNKGRRPTVIKKDDVVPSPAQVREEIESHKEVKQKEPKERPVKEEKDEVKVEINKEEHIEESKIDEFIKSERKSIKKLSSTPIVKRKSKVIHKPVLFMFFLCVIVGAIYLSGNNFKKADIEITPKHQLITYKDKQFTAGKDESSSNVNFEIMITPNKKSVEVILTDSKEVSIKAEGSITLYNEFSTKAEKLSAGAFLSDNTGKTYKTNSTVSIPGYKTVDKKIVPGQVIVKITSFLPGDAYNGSPTDFNISSFKGTAKYKKIYGKLKSPLIGGASGVVYVLDDRSKKNIDNIANTSFKNDLLAQVKTLVPPGYIIYPGALTFSYDGIENVLSKTSQANVEINGTLAVVILKEKSLMDNIIKISLPNITKANELKEIQILDLNKLTFNFTDKEQVITKEINNVTFTLSGVVDAIWQPDVNTLKAKLTGINKNDVLTVFRQDPGVASALVKIFPPWQKYIPDDPSKINLHIE